MHPVTGSVRASTEEDKMISLLGETEPSTPSRSATLSGCAGHCAQDQPGAVDLGPRTTRSTRGKGGFGNFERLKPRGTDCTTAQKTCVGVPEHLRSSSSSKVDAHTTLRAVSAIPLSTRHDPRFRKFDTHARTHFESTDTQHSAHTTLVPSAIAGRPCHHSTLQHAKRACTGSPNMAPDTIVRIRSHTHAQHCNICKRAPAAQ